MKRLSARGAAAAAAAKGVMMLLLAAASLVGCGGAPPSQGSPQPAETATGTRTPTAPPQSSPTPTVYVSPTPAPTLPPPAWKLIAPGISRVYLPVPTPGTSEPSYFYALRIDPNRVTFKVIYDPKLPHKVDEWSGITKAAIVFNAGFFTGGNAPNGRIISDGTLYGSTPDYGSDSLGVRGLFAVTGQRVDIFTLGRDNFNPQGLRFDQAVEAYPMLVLPGGQPTFPEDTHKRARRTVIGLDQDNQVIVVISDIPLYSLYELAEWAAGSNLGLDSALNLDGGRSTGIEVSLPNEQKLINSYVPVPIVITVNPAS